MQADSIEYELDACLEKFLQAYSLEYELVVCIVDKNFHFLAVKSMQADWLTKTQTFTGVRAVDLWSCFTQC